MLTESEKNTKILNRFETKELGTKIKKYDVTVNNKQFPMICMNGESLQEARITCVQIWGDRLQDVAA